MEHAPNLTTAPIEILEEIAATHNLEHCTCAACCEIRRREEEDQKL